MRNAPGARCQQGKYRASSLTPTRDTPSGFRLERHGHVCAICPAATSASALRSTHLHYLIAHLDRVVTRQELLEQGWPERFVSEATLDHRVMQARQAIGDSGQRQRRIHTLRSRGYRFVGPVEERTAASPPLRAAVLPQAVATDGPPATLVGREVELAQLHQWYAAACQGQRQMVCVTGELGIGKTTLVDAFVTRVATSADLWLGRGQCIEHHGPGEAYLPLLEVLSQLGRAPDGNRLVPLLHQYAPSWLLHLPRLVPLAEREAVQRRVSGATRERMLRELAEAIEALTTVRPLVLEDLHWSDDATLDWLVYMARRREEARLLLIGTYRSFDAAVQAHPVRRVGQDLLVHGQCAEIRLGYVSEAAVATYLTQRFVGTRFPEALARVLHHRTSGNPLFLVTIVDALVRQGVLRAGATGWELAGELTTAAAHIPETLRQLLEQHVEQLPHEEQTLLEAASVAGVEFAVAAVAAALGWTVADVEERCAALARRGQFLRMCGTDIWADGTVASRYAFLHALYRETLYERVPVGRRVRWHQQIGQRLEAGYDPQARERAAELAEHFVRGRDTVRAIKYLYYAGEQARQRSAHQEALQHLTQGLALLATLPETPARVQQELDMQLALGSALMATKGLAAPEVKQVYTRALVLCQQLGETPQLSPTLLGLLWFHQHSGALSTAQELGEQLLRLAQHTTAPRLEAHATLGGILFYQGEYAAAWRHLEQGMALSDPAAQRTLMPRQHMEPGVMCLGFAALALWCLGYPAQAMRRSQEALAQEPAHPYNLAYARFYAARLHYHRREPHAVQAQADALLALATEQGFGLFVGFATWWRGWVLALQSQDATGLAQMRQGMATVLAAGQMLSKPYCLLLLAEATGHVGQVEEGLDLLTEALTTLEAIGRGDLLAEAYRLQGVLLLRQRVPNTPQAEACFQQALAIAHRQQARAWELRAAVSLSRLWQRQGKRLDARQLLAPVYDWFTEGLETADLQEVRTLLDELAGSA